MKDNHLMLPEALNEGGLPKKAISILRKCDRLVSFYLRQQSQVRRISLFRTDRLYLAEQLEKNGQDINNVRYKGFSLE